MNKRYVLILFFLIAGFLYSQNKEEAEKLVEEGVTSHDKGDFDIAIARYNQALDLDRNNLLALAEKAITLNSQEKFEESVTFSKKAIESHPGDPGLRMVYVTCGNSLDALKRTDESVSIYEEGLKIFPDFYLLHFNKGITLSTVKKYAAAIKSFQLSAALNPRHASSHHALGVMEKINNKRIASLLSYCRFLVLEPQGSRAKGNLESVKKIMMGNVEETGKKSITVNFDPGILGDTLEDGSPAENSFTTADIVLSFSSALDYDKKNKKKSDVEQFIRKFDAVCSTLKETARDNYGFYWDYYVPYFIQIKDRELIETFAYIAFATDPDPGVSKWLDKHKEEIDAFYDWSKSFEWLAGDTVK